MSAAIEKPWGITRLLHCSALSEVWHASIQAGGKSSRHLHRHKHNHFYVVSGQLWVHADPDSSYLLSPGTEVTIVAGRLHQFEAITDVELIETYFLDPIDTTDIERFP